MSLYEDPQADAVYAWEAAAVRPYAQELADKQACHDLISYASGWIGIPPPRIAFARLQVHCWARPAENLIYIAPWGRNPSVLLHELAHIADFSLPPLEREWEGHGPSFVGLAMDLYTQFIDLERRKLEETATAMGVEFAPPRLLVPRRRLSSEVDFFDGDL